MNNSDIMVNTDHQLLPSFQELENEILDINIENIFDVIKSTYYRDYNSIIIHHTYSPDIPNWSRNYGKIINRYHYEINGWNYGLGYNLLLTWNPNNENEFRLQTSYRWNYQVKGAHTINRTNFLNGLDPNSYSIGIGIVGNFDIYFPSASLYSKIKEIINILCQRFNISSNNIYGHYQFDYKTCPGKNFHIDNLK